MQRRSKSVADEPVGRAVLALGLDGVDTEEAHRRVLRLLDTGIDGVGSPEALVRLVQKLSTIVLDRIPVADVGEFRRRLLAAEAAHKASLDATRQLAAPARRQTIAVEAGPGTAAPVEGVPG